jgi:hypothetical protein
MLAGARANIVRFSRCFFAAEMRASSLLAVTLPLLAVAQPYGKLESLPGWSPVNNQAMYSGCVNRS